MNGLTNQQARLLDFIRHRAAENGVPPSYDEMAQHLGLASKSGVHRLVLGLEERGRISRAHNRARSLRVVVGDADTEAAKRVLRDAIDGRVAPFAAIACALSALGGSA